MSNIDREAPIQRVKPISALYLTAIIAVIYMGFSAKESFMQYTADVNVSVSTDPSEAFVMMDNKTLCRATPCEFTIKMYEYSRIQIHKPGYKTLDSLESFDLNGTGSQRLNITLEPVEESIEIQLAMEACQLKRANRESNDFDKKNLEVEYCYRIPPLMPAGAKRSGHCKAEFDVSPQGLPHNIRIFECTDAVFEMPSRIGIMQWRYLPEIKNGRAVNSKGIENKLTYRLTDKRGVLIPPPASLD